MMDANMNELNKKVNAVLTAMGPDKFGKKMRQYVKKNGAAEFPELLNLTLNLDKVVTLKAADVIHKKRRLGINDMLDIAPHRIVLQEYLIKFYASVLGLENER